jgi:hypothetical protein
LSTEKDHHSIAFRWDESQEEDIFDTAVVTFQGRLAELVLWMETHFFVSGADEMVDDVGSRGRSTGVAEPFIAGETFHYAAGRMDTTVTTISALSATI